MVVEEQAVRLDLDEEDKRGEQRLVSGSFGRDEESASARSRYLAFSSTKTHKQDTNRDEERDQGKVEQIVTRILDAKVVRYVCSL